VVLPDGREIAAPTQGLWPRVISYPAGVTKRYVDIYDGSKSRSVLMETPATGEGSAYAGFKVEEWSELKPRKRRKDSGVVDTVFFLDEPSQTVRIGFIRDMQADIAKRLPERPRSLTPRLRRLT
jgi:hypothetical protein